MRATARVIRGSVRAQATATGNVGAVAYAMPGILSVAGVMPNGMAVVAAGMPQGIRSKAWPTDKAGLSHFLHVAPEAPQHLVWLVPQYGIDYIITTSSGLEWQIK